MAKIVKTGELERCLLACFFKDPEWLGEISGVLKSDFFAVRENQQVFSAIKILYEETKTLDQHLLVYRLNLMGMSHVGALEVADYVASITGMSINLGSKVAYLDELTKFYWSRQTYKKIAEAERFIQENVEKPDLSFRDILSGAERIMVDGFTLEAVGGDDTRIVDLYAEGRNYVNNAVLNKGRNGLWSPFPRFNDIFGSFYFGGLFMFAARSKVGKSTFLAFLSDHFAATGEGKTKICYCDTEMSPDEVYFRNLSAKTGVEESDIREGTFSESAALVAKINSGMDDLEKYKELIYHVHVPNESMDELESIVRRWYSKNVKEGDIGVICYDYVKLTGEVNANAQEWQMIGEKTNRLKMLAKSFPNVFVISSTQLNEQDGVSQSARIKWFCDSLFILQKKSPEEFGQLGAKWGTHILFPVVTRKLGKKYRDFVDVTGTEGGKQVWRPNHLNFHIENFRIEERGTLEDAMRDSGGQLTPRKTSFEKNKETYQKHR